jgi:hypothetical protein
MDGLGPDANVTVCNRNGIKDTICWQKLTIIEGGWENDMGCSAQNQRDCFI